jgi:hypothetical protein
MGYGTIIGGWLLFLIIGIAAYARIIDFWKTNNGHDETTQ